MFWWTDWSPSFEPFSRDWVKIWGALTLKPSVFKNSELLYPGALARYQKFREKNGIDTLERLASKGAEPNFIMPILIAYLWNDEVPQTRRKDEIVKNLQEVQRCHPGDKRILQNVL